MALGSQVIDFVRLYLLDNANQVGGIGEIPVVHKKVDLRFMGVLIKMVNPGGVKRGGPPFDPMHPVTFL